MSNKTQRNITNGASHTYQYDNLYRLKPHTYDDVGNRTDSEYSLGGTLADTYKMNEYESTPQGAMVYDDNGNLKEIGTSKDLAYDYRNQMESFSQNGTTSSYRYDALGRRISKSNSNGETRYYNFGSRVVAEANGSNAVQASYVYGGYIDEVLNMERGSIDYYYHSDDQFNVMALTDGINGALLEKYDYNDFGTPSIMDENGNARSSSIASNPYLFNGRHYDPESGLYYYRTRYMDPNAGRFTTRDSIGIWGDPSNLGNGYTYVGNNPFSFLDPFGLDYIAVHVLLPDFTTIDPRTGKPLTGHAWIEHGIEQEDGTFIVSTYSLWPDNAGDTWGGAYKDIITNDPNISDLRKDFENNPLVRSEYEPDASRYYHLTEEEELLFNKVLNEWLTENKVYDLFNKNCVSWDLAVLNGVLNEHYWAIGRDSIVYEGLNHTPYIGFLMRLRTKDSDLSNFLRSPKGIFQGIISREHYDRTDKDNHTDKRYSPVLGRPATMEELNKTRSGNRRERRYTSGNKRR